jgi:hypothetical protein
VQLLLTLCALLLLGEMVPHRTTGDRPDNAVMAGQVTRHGTDRSTLDAATRFDAM